MGSDTFSGSLYVVNVGHVRSTRIPRPFFSGNASSVYVLLVSFLTIMQETDPDRCTFWFWVKF